MNGTDDKAKHNTLSVILANIHSLRANARIVAALQADVAVIQETMLAPRAIAETSTVLRERSHKMTHGLPCQPQLYRQNVVVTHVANEADSGGAATVTKQHLKSVCGNVHQHVLELYGTAR